MRQLRCTITPLFVTLTCVFGGQVPKSLALINAASRGDVASVRAALSAGCGVDDSVEFEGVKGWTPLMAAAKAGQTAVVDVLLRARANPNAMNEFGATAVDIAILSGHRDVAKQLFDRGGKGRDYPSALSLAVADVETSQMQLVTLQEAVAKGLVQASFSGWGSSSGEAISMEIRKTASAGTTPLIVSVPAGSRLFSANPRDQSMVIGEVSGGKRVILFGTRPIRVILVAFCMDFERNNPSASTEFRLESPDPVLSCITAESRNLSVAARQAAVWIRTNGLTFSRMAEKFKVRDFEYNQGVNVAKTCGALL